MNVILNASLAQAQGVWQILQDADLLVGVASAVCAVITLVWLFDGLRNLHTKRGEIIYYIVLCTCGVVWCAIPALCRLAGGSWVVQGWPLTLRFALQLYIPAILCLHIWRQVSFRPFTAKLFVALLLPPTALVAARVWLQTAPTAPIQGMVALLALAYAFSAIVLLRGVLLCVNVLYQVPRHMRRPVYYLLWSAGFCTLFVFSPLLTISWLSWLVCLVGLLGLLGTLHEGLRIGTADDLIVTSRDHMFENQSTSILVMNNDTQILNWNHLHGQGHGLLPPPQHREGFLHYRTRILKKHGGRLSPHGDNIVSILSGGQEHHFLFTTHEIWRKNRQLGFITEIVDVTKLYATFRHLEDIAMMDVLTGLHSRNAYISMVEKIITPQNMPLLVLIGDVNGLKSLNDTKGHIAGDALLTAVAESIRGALPQLPNAFAARIGGDEFTILAPGKTQTDAFAFVNNVNQRCAAINDEVFGTPTISWGYAVMQSTDEQYNEVFKAADAMMYKVKREQFVFRPSGLLPKRPAAWAPPPPMAEATAPAVPVPVQATEPAKEDSPHETA